MASSKDISYIDFVFHCYLYQIAEYLAWKLISDKNSGAVMTTMHILS